MIQTGWSKGHPYVFGCGLRNDQGRNCKHKQTDMQLGFPWAGTSPSVYVIRKMF